MKMHFPISIMEETTCSQRDLHRHCFLIPCLFLFPSPASSLCAALTVSSFPFIFLFKSCIFRIQISCVPVKANQSPVMRMSWADMSWHIWNPLMSPPEFCWCLCLISLRIHHRILTFTPWRIHVLNWINVRLCSYCVGLEFVLLNTWL